MRTSHWGRLRESKGLDSRRPWGKVAEPLAGVDPICPNRPPKSAAIP